MARYTDSIFYLSAGAAQVWSALMVFHILLIRDLKHHVEQEIDSLWGDAKLWWPKLLLALRSPDGLKSKLGDFGLTHETILRADTHKNSFIRLIAAIKTHQIISTHGETVGPLDDQELTPSEWQLKFEPIAERIQELEEDKPEKLGAFYIGVTGIAMNFIACCLGSFLPHPVTLLAFLLIANLTLLAFFGLRIKKALDHFNVTAQHDAIKDQLKEFENQKKNFWRARGARKSGHRNDRVA